MAISNVKRIHGIKCSRYLFNQGIITNHPEQMANTAISHQINIRNTFCGRHQHGVDLLLRLIGQQHRAGLRVQGLDLANPVVFLVRAGKLMLANPVTVIGSDRCSSHQAGLTVLPHNHTIDVVTGDIITHQYALPQHLLQVSGCPGIHLGRMWVSGFREVNLGLGDMQKTPGTSGYPHPGLGTAENIIRRGDYIDGPLCNGAQGGKGSYQRHGLSTGCVRNIGRLLYTVRRNAAICENGGNTL